MTVEKEKKVVYKNIIATQEEQKFCKYILELIPEVIADKAVSEYYENHEDELLINFLEDIANTGNIDVSEYE